MPSRQVRPTTPAAPTHLVGVTPRMLRGRDVCGFIGWMKSRREFSRSLPALAAPLGYLPARAATKGEYLAYTGTYTEKKSKGIYAFRYQAGTGKLTPVG